MCINVLKDQQMHFGFMDVILFQRGHQHVSATHVTIFRVMRTRTQTYLKYVSISPEFKNHIVFVKIHSFIIK